MAREKLKRYKSPGIGQIPAEFIKAAGSKICSEIHKLINSIWNKEELHVARMGERRGAYRVLVGKPYGRRPLERPRCRREDNIKIDLKMSGMENMD
jgi:hypothetical protein